LATVRVLDEFAPTERHTHDRSDKYRRALAALEGEAWITEWR
jgi:hypothetical protein